MPVDYFYKTLEGKEGFDYQNKCYPSPSNIQVFKYRDDPISYEIKAGFEGVSSLIETLRAPHHFNRIYCLRIFSGAMSVPKSDESFKRFMGYTVEQFGLLMVPEFGIRGGADAGHTILKKSNYLCLPLYWSERPGYRVQVWRTRIFDCPLSKFPTSLSSPLGPDRWINLYMEERWHPNTGKKRSLTWYEHRCKSGGKIEQFRKDALLILGDPIRTGRPKIHADPNIFLLEVRRKYEEIAESCKKDPTAPDVAFEMEVTLPTFNRRLKEYGIPWPPRGKL
jgi:hypothetical protein